MKRSQTFNNDYATLYVIATPIGNLQEISPRIIDALNCCEVIFCEDTRVSFKLLQHLNIQKPLFSAYENIEKAATEKIINYLKNGKNVAFLSDAGYPGISDPGQLIINQVRNYDFNVAIINGPSALIHSLVGSGFPSDHFYFYGFLPPKKNQRKMILEKLKTFEDTLIFYQSPHKVEDCLKDMQETLGDRSICLCRELTKKFEEFIFGNISEIIPICNSLKGEMVIVCSGYKNQTIKNLDQNLLDEINLEIANGLSTSLAIKKIAQKYQLKKNEVYSFYIQGGKNHGE